MEGRNKSTWKNFQPGSPQNAQWSLKIQALIQTEPALKHWWQIGNTDVLAFMPHVISNHQIKEPQPLCSCQSLGSIKSNPVWVWTFPWFFDKIEALFVCFLRQSWPLLHCVCYFPWNSNTCVPTNINIWYQKLVQKNKWFWFFMVSFSLLFSIHFSKYTKGLGSLNRNR